MNKLTISHVREAAILYIDGCLPTRLSSTLHRIVSSSVSLISSLMKYRTSDRVSGNGLRFSWFCATN